MTLARIALGESVSASMQAAGSSSQALNWDDRGVSLSAPAEP